MADETIAVLEQLGVDAAHLVGYSDGGIVTLHVARRRPDLVRTMVLIGTNFHTNGLVDGWIDPASPMLHTPYGLKEVALYTTEPTMTVDDLRRLTMPALVLVGDDDAVRLDHTMELYTALPNAQLAVVPGTSHVLVMEKPALVTTIIDEFLSTGGAVATILPIRRR